MHIAMRGVGIALAAAVLCAAPPRAEAQFGRLKAKIGEKMGEKVGGKEKGAGTTAIRASKVAFSDNVVEITDARIDALIRGLAAQAEARPRIAREATAADANFASAQKAFDAKYAQWEKDDRAYMAAKDRWDTCRQQLSDRFMAEEEKHGAEQEKIQEEAEASMDEARQARIQALAAKMQAAQQRGDQKTMMAYNDSMRAELSGVMATSQKSMQLGKASEQRGKANVAEMEAKCGKEPQAPARPKPPASSSDIRAKLDSIFVAGTGRTLDAGSAPVMRERVVGWMEARRAGRGAGSYVFTQEELEALAAREKELEPYFEQMANPEPWFVGKKG